MAKSNLGAMRLSNRRAASASVPHSIGSDLSPRLRTKPIWKLRSPLLPKEKLQFYRRVRALAPIAAKRGGAMRLTHTLLAAWLNRKYPLLSQATLVHVQSLSNDSQVLAFADWLASHELLEGAFWLSSAYATWVGDEVRREKAMFFTPPELSARLIADVFRRGVRFDRAVFADPACGGGAFLAPIAMRMRKELQGKGYGPKRILNHVRTHLLGIDMDPVLCRLSTYFLKMALYEEIVAAGKEPRFRVRQANALTQARRLYSRVDVVICNPPYRKMPSAEVSLYKVAYGKVIERQPNLYGLFFDLALKLLKPNGTAALLTATSFLSGQHFSKLRTHLLHQARAKQIDIVGERNGIFVGAELDTAITVFQKRGRGLRRANRTIVYSLNRAKKFQRIGSYRMPNSGTAWPVPKSPEDAKAIEIAGDSQYRLSDYGYNTRVGTFVWNRDRRRKFVSERAAKRRAKVKAAFPLIWSSDISQGGRVKFGYRPSHDSFVSMGNADHPSLIRNPAVVLQRVTSSDQPRRLVGAPISRRLLNRYGGVVGENHVVFLEQATGISQISPRQFARVLRSNSIDCLFRSLSGAANVSAFELSQLPMPNPEFLRKQLRRTIDTDFAVRRAFRETVRLNSRK